MADLTYRRSLSCIHISLVCCCVLPVHSGAFCPKCRSWLAGAHAGCCVKHSPRAACVAVIAHASRNKPLSPEACKTPYMLYHILLAWAGLCDSMAFCACPSQCIYIYSSSKNVHNKNHRLALFLMAYREVKAQPLNVSQPTELEDVDVISAFDIHDVDSYDSD